MVMPLDLTGQRYGRLTVVCRAEESTKYGQTRWQCKCDCGHERIVVGNNLRNKNTQSCGCLARETIKRRGPGRNNQPCGTSAAYSRGCKCAACLAAHAARVRADNRKPGVAARKVAATADWRRRNPRKHRDQRLARYGLTQNQFENIFESQGKRCGACSAADPGTKLGWVVDHDHDTGFVRGILCGKCNVTLGMMGDNADGVLATTEMMLAYLCREIG